MSRSENARAPLSSAASARPFIIGVPAERLDELRALPLSDVLFVDLDRGALYVGGGADDDGMGGARDGEESDALPPSMVSRAPTRRARAADSVHHARLRLQRAAVTVFEALEPAEPIGTGGDAAFTLYADLKALCERQAERAAGAGAAGAGAGACAAAGFFANAGSRSFASSPYCLRHLPIT